MRFYLEAEGALRSRANRLVQAGDWIVSSALALPASPSPRRRRRVLEREINATLPLRLIGLNSKSGYSTAAFGFRPFDIDTGSDRSCPRGCGAGAESGAFVLANERARSAEPARKRHLQTRRNQWRWTSGRAMLLLKPPHRPRRWS